MSEPTVCTLSFTQQEMLLLERAIGDLPYRLAAPLVESINRQTEAAQAEMHDHMKRGAEPDDGTGN